ncbi:S9 family peptidase [Candidatus Leptofilum sp.]|uniref:S9 family peptidase n=1 Tax=Candidatus Leptofilum sp. TaxID=3241576 RepID=UPI003B58D917
MNSKPTPPIAAVKPKELTLHGHSRIDNYFWLREKENPEVIAYLEAENAYTEAMMAHTRPLQEELYEEMVGRIQETDSTAPVKKGDFYYYSRTEAGKQYQIHCRKHGSLDAPEEILLDENVLAAESSYFRLGIFAVSPNQQLLAYSTDSSGGERYILVVKDLTTGEMLTDVVPDTFYSVEWANDNQNLFYSKQDDAWRSYKIFRHTLGTEASEDVEVYHEPDELFNAYLHKTRDDAYLVITSASMETTEQHFLDANIPGGDFGLLAPRKRGWRYFLNHHQGEFFILSNEDAPNNKLMITAVANPSPEHWQTFIPHNPDKLLENVDVFADHLVVYGRFNGLHTLDIHNFNSDSHQAVTFPEPVYAVEGSNNPEFVTDRLRFVYTSLTTADTTVELDMNTLEWHTIKQLPVLGGYDPANYQSERTFATAPDGTQVPISLVYRKGLVRDGSNPCLLYGYGSYGASMSPSFDQKRLSLIDRGFVYAIAHIRGGKEMGRHWYDQGKWLHKKNTFTDFIACARHLINEKYTNREKLAVNGRSAGGLLMGAVTVMAPELFKVVVAGVPFVDVVSTMLDESIPLTVGEFEEWGNPKEEKYYNYMLSYSPYDNTTAQAYPHILITAGLNDPRVQYWEPAKWIAKLRALKTDDNLLLLKTHMGAGHFASSGRYDYLRDIAFDYAFILGIIGQV